APGNLRAWLGKVLTNIARMRHRGRQRALRRELLAHRADAPPSPAEMAARLELERKIVDAVTDLREPYRSTLLLHFYDGLGPAEIARHLGVPASTVRVRLKRALAIVRARLEHDSDDRRALMLGLLLLAERPRRFPVAVAAAVALLAAGGATYYVATDERPPPRAPLATATLPDAAPPSPAPLPRLLTGRVIDAYDRPRAGFAVDLCEAPPRGRFHDGDPRPVEEARTDADGAYRLEIPAGRWLVRTGEEQAIVEEPGTIDFRVGAGPERGRVTEGGLPVAGAVVTSPFGRAVTDRDGGFALDPPLAVRVRGLATRLFDGPPYEIVRGEPFPLGVPAALEAPGATGEANGEFPADEATAIVRVPGFAPRRVSVRRGDTVALAPGRRIEGVVRCEGAGVPDAEVTWVGGFDRVLEIARTDAQGRFVVKNVPDEAVALTATHPDFLPKGLDLASFLLGGSGGTLDPDIEMVRAVERRGTVGVAGARITAWPPGLPRSGEVRRALERAGLDWTAVSRADGTFVLRQLPPGVPLAIVAETADGFAEGIDAFDLSLRPWPVTDGDVVDEYGTPVGGALVRGGRLRARSEPDGRFRLHGRVEGELVVSHPDFPSVIVRDPARIVLPRGEAIRGIVDAPGALVLAGPRSAYADAKGAFEIRGLERGSFTVFFHAAGRVARAVEAAAPGAPLDVMLERAGRLEGRVTRRGAPIADARVCALADWPLEEATTDADGRFVLERVPGRAAFALRVVAGGREERIEAVTAGTREIELP
ncbi:MAG TPA: sigma-70 family RNA polymerase sigma factor, partial [Planctomycetota bacterium]|nr:sigma-70 family RNA polymerase sigma factor [Planctomycetota bacterium]